MKTHNFSARPCILPDEVFKKASDAILDFDNSLSLIELKNKRNSTKFSYTRKSKIY